MKTQISFHNLDTAAHDGLENTIHELARRHIERYLSRFPSDAVALQVHLEKSRHRNYYRVSTQLVVPGGTLTGRQEGYELMTALRKSIDELERELLRHISRLRQDDAWRRKERREELRRLKKAIDAKPDTGAEAFGDLVRALLPKLQHFVQREVSALRARGDLNLRYPTPQEIVDEVLARAYQRLGERPKDLDPLHWLYQLTHEVLNDEVRQYRREGGRFVSTESAPPPPRDYTIDEQDQGVFEFWQPDEMLKLEDVVPVTEATPETKLEDEELRKYFHDALARMPNNWRRAIWLTQAEGIPVAKVARMMGASEEEVKRWIQQGDEYLRAQLREAGYQPAEEGKLPAYFVPTQASATPELAAALDEVTRGAR
jgi:RNA polymerase sigma factor (sigma-70 family)